ncbi:MAG: CoA-binding protein [Bacteroidales bacterium]|nr:CoA-binding protein [Bacteroidales bacterium]
MKDLQKKTVVIGASSRPNRYSYSAVKQLKRFGIEVVAIGLRNETIEDIPIITGFPEIDNVHTISLYVGPQNQPPYYDYIINKLKPHRLIFNPGTENTELYQMAAGQNIEVVEDCTLMMLADGMY